MVVVVMVDVYNSDNRGGVVVTVMTTILIVAMVVMVVKNKNPLMTVLKRHNQRHNPRLYMVVL